MPRSLTVFAVFAVLATGLSACKQKPDDYYVGPENARIAEQIREVFNGPFSNACDMLSDDHPSNHRDPGEPGKDEMIAKALARRDSLRSQARLTPEQKDALPGDLKCMLAEKWACTNFSVARNEEGPSARCGAPR